MITLTKSGNAIVFTFDDNDHYLNDGKIEVPVNSLTLVTDESQMATFRKSASNDIFISATYDELGMSKADLESWFKENAFDTGVTPEDVQDMIDESISGKADTTAVTASINAAVSGKMDTSSFNTYSASTDARLSEDEEVTSAALNSLNSNKQDKLTAGENITINGNVISAAGGNNVIELTQAQYDALTDIDPDAFYIITDADGGVTTGQVQTMIDDSISGKADTSAVTEAVSSKMDTSSFNIYSASTDARLAEDEEVTAAALNALDEKKADVSAVTESLSGKQDTLVAGSGITIDTGNTISFGLPIYSGKTGTIFRPTYNNNSITIGQSSNFASITAIAGGANCTAQNYSISYGGRNNATKAYSCSVGYDNKSNNNYETSLGQFNNSVSATDTFGDSGNTLFSVGNGTADNARHNAFEIRQNGDIYCNNGTADIKLQDYLQIKVMAISQADYDALVQGGTVDANTLYVITGSN